MNAAGDVVVRVAGGVELHHLALDGVLRELEVEEIGEPAASAAGELLRLLAARCTSRLGSAVAAPVPSPTSRRSPAPSAPAGRRRRTTSTRNAIASSVIVTGHVAEAAFLVGECPLR